MVGIFNLVRAENLCKNHVENSLFLMMFLYNLRLNSIMDTPQKDHSNRELPSSVRDSEFTATGNPGSAEWKKPAVVVAMAGIALVILGGVLGYVIVIKGLEKDVEALQRHVDDLDVVVSQLSEQQTAIRIDIGRLVTRIETLEQLFGLQPPSRVPEPLESDPLLTNLQAMWVFGQTQYDVTGEIDRICEGEYPCTADVSVTDLGTDLWPDFPENLHIKFDCDGEQRTNLYEIEDTITIRISC